MGEDKPLKGFEAGDLDKIRRRARKGETALETECVGDAAEADERIEELRQRIFQMEQELKTCCRRFEEAKKPDSGLLGKDSLYVVVLGAVIIAVALLVVYGWAQKPTVSISFDVGNIIGGMLVGIAALVASLTYARKERDEGGVPPEGRDSDREASPVGSGD